MAGSIISGLIAAFISIVTKILSKDVAEEVLKKVLVVALPKIVASTKNDVDDEMIKPIIEALKK